MKETTHELTRFELYEDGFYVEASVDPRGLHVFYLCHCHHVHKSYMFSMPPQSNDKDQWMRLINYLAEIYIKLYWGEIEAMEKREDAEAEGQFWEEVEMSISYLAKKGTKVTEIP